MHYPLDANFQNLLSTALSFLTFDVLSYVSFEINIYIYSSQFQSIIRRLYWFQTQQIYINFLRIGLGNFSDSRDMQNIFYLHLKPIKINQAAR